MKIEREYYDSNFIFNDPIDYFLVKDQFLSKKNKKRFLDNKKKYGEIMLRQIKMKDYISFHYCIDVFLFEKNRENDIKTIKMSYLDYIFEKMKNDKEGIISFKLSNILDLCIDLKEPIRFFRDNKDKIVLMINGFEINGDDFENIRGIICEQNMIDLPDENIDPELKKVLDDALAFKMKTQEKMGSLEDQIVCIMASTNYTEEKIKEMYLRKFTKLLQRIDHTMHYKIYKSAELSGATFKSKITHWRADLSQDKYDGLAVEYGNFKEKINGKK